MNDHDSYAEPIAVDLAAIEFERPLIEAELNVLGAEIEMLYAADRGTPTALDWKRLRRANRRLISVALTMAAGRRHDLCRPYREVEVGMSTCRYGCKVMRCTECETEQVWHNATYGCRGEQAAAPLRAA